MVDKKIEDILLGGLEHARRVGLGDIELYLLSDRSLSIKVHRGDLDEFQNARSMGLGVRIIKDNSCGYSYTEDLSLDSVNSALEKASEIARLNPPDDHNSLRGPEKSYPPPPQIDPGIEESPVSRKIEMALTLERTALEADKRIINVPEASYGDGCREVTILNSKGMNLTYAAGGAGISIGLMAREGDEVKSPFKYKYSRSLNNLKPHELALETAREALALLGARQAAPGTLPVVFHNEAGREILGAFSGMFSARSVQKGVSLLKGKLGERVGSAAVEMHDNGLFPEGPVSRPFDDEGTASHDTPLVEGGILKNYLHNHYTAAKDGVDSTGNASRGSISAALEVAPSNFYLAPGEGTPDDLMKEAGEGIMVVDLQGLHSGTNAISGDFSLGAQGYYFRGGKVSHPLHNFTVAGNFLSMLADFVRAAGDLEFSYPRGNTSIGSPSFLISNLAISGEA